MKYFVYILRSTIDSSFYIGYTKDLERRLKEHNETRLRYTARNSPWELYYYEEYTDKGDAIKREKFLKKQKNRSFYERLRDKE